jgi:hypothetical protein
MPKSSMNTIYMYIKIQSVNKIKHYYPIYRYKPSRKRDLPMKNTMYTIWVLGTKFVSYFNRIFTLWKWFTTQCRPYCKKIKQFFPHLVKAFGFVWGFFVVEHYLMLMHSEIWNYCLFDWVIFKIPLTVSLVLDLDFNVSF